MPVEGDAEREQEFGVAAAAPGAAHRHRRLSAGNQYTGFGKGFAVPRHLTRDGCMDLSRIARLSFDGIAQYVDGDSGMAAHVGGGLQGHLRRGYGDRPGTREPRAKASAAAA